MAFLPYLVVIVVFGLAKLLAPAEIRAGRTDCKIPWPGLDGQILNHHRHHLDGDDRTP